MGVGWVGRGSITFKISYSRKVIYTAAIQMHAYVMFKKKTFFSKNFAILMLLNSLLFS